MNLSIAIAQMQVTPGDPAANITKMEQFIQAAAKRGADLVVFPEDAICGPLAGQNAFVAEAPGYLAHMQKLAVTYGVDLVPGTWTVGDGIALYNQAHYISADGTLAGIYRKINLWETEKVIIAPGASVSVFPTRFGLVGMVVCWDIAFPPIFTAMNQLGVELVVSPTFWSVPLHAPGTPDALAARQEDIDLIDSLCTARAFENDIVFVYCNAAGTLNLPGSVVTLSGCSQITHPVDKVICRSDGNHEDLLVAEVFHQRSAAAPTVPV
ncbi:carbon-nitrogen hydrolase family protein [Dokdonella sp.]|uniref:carbon-nitrogen hydrolase family protein n=1 Tax=Dokdonella sp. TaxID=2291710 RepID=UPI003C5F4D4A